MRAQPWAVHSKGRSPLICRSKCYLSETSPRLWRWRHHSILFPIRCLDSPALAFRRAVPRPATARAPWAWGDHVGRADALLDDGQRPFALCRAVVRTASSSSPAPAMVLMTLSSRAAPRSPRWNTTHLLLLCRPRKLRDGLFGQNQTWPALAGLASPDTCSVALVLSSLSSNDVKRLAAFAWPRPPPSPTPRPVFRFFR